MSAFYNETVTHVHHWNDTLFSFKTTRDAHLRFKNGQFVMIGLEVNGKPLTEFGPNQLRAQVEKEISAVYR